VPCGSRSPAAGKVRRFGTLRAPTRSLRPDVATPGSHVATPGSNVDGGGTSSATFDETIGGWSPGLPRRHVAPSQRPLAAAAAETLPARSWRNEQGRLRSGSLHHRRDGVAGARRAERCPSRACREPSCAAATARWPSSPSSTSGFTPRGAQRPRHLVHGDLVTVRSVRPLTHRRQDRQPEPVEGSP
jgi:hypothetical protein